MGGASPGEEMRQTTSRMYEENCSHTGKLSTLEQFILCYVSSILANQGFWVAKQMKTTKIYGESC